MNCHLHPETIAWYYWQPGSTNLYITFCLACSARATDDGNAEELYEMPYGAKERKP